MIQAYKNSGFLILFGMCTCLLSSALEVSQVANPWDSTYAPLGRVESNPLEGSLTLEAARNGHPAAALSIFNDTNQTEYLQVRVSAQGGAPSLELREGVHIRARLGQLVADALPRLGEEGLIVIASGENRQIWLECSSTALDAGAYRWELEILNLKTKEVQRIPVVLEVADLELPTEHPLSVMVWDCSLQGSRGELQARYIEELTSHYVNTFHVLEQAPATFNESGEMVVGPDFSELDEIVVPLAGKGQLMLRCAQPRLTLADGTSLSIESEVGKKAYGQWLVALVDHLEGHGLTYDDWVLYPYDERLDDYFHHTALAAREADPRARIYANPSSHVTPEQINRQIENYHVDYIQWAPVWLNSAANREYVRSIREDELVFTATYWCPVIQKRLSPVGFYRSMAWRAWRHDLQGVGYWTALGLGGYKTSGDWGGTPWDDFEARTANPTSVYPGQNNAIIPSRRWRAFRAGLEDYLYLTLLEQAVEERQDERGLQLLKQAEYISYDNFNDASVVGLRSDIVDYLTKP